MELQAKGMELASEIVIKASIFGMETCDVPKKLHLNGGDWAPHLAAFVMDGAQNFHGLKREIVLLKE